MFQYATGRASRPGTARARARLELDRRRGRSRLHGASGATSSVASQLDVTTRPRRAGRGASSRSVLPSRRPALRDLVEPLVGRPCPEPPRRQPTTHICAATGRTITYFEERGARLRRDFTFRPEIAAQQAASAPTDRRIAGATVSLHVRRSDTLTTRCPRPDGTLEPEYYSHALDALGSGIGSVRLFVFTDDPEWCRSNLRLSEQDVVLGATRARRQVGVDDAPDDPLRPSRAGEQQLQLVGRWLSPSPAKIVVAPRPWAGLTLGRERSYSGRAGSGSTAATTRPTSRRRRRRSRR